MEKRRKEATRRDKTREKSPFPFHIPGPCCWEGSWMLRVPPAPAAPPGKSWALPTLSLPFLGSVPHQWAHGGGMKVVPGPLEGTLRGRYLEPVRILLTSGSAPGEHDGANIHQPTLVIPARCPRWVCASKSLGESKDRGGKKRKISSFNPPRTSLASSRPAPRGAAGSPALNSSHCIPCTPCPLPGTACPAV